MISYTYIRTDTNNMFKMGKSKDMIQMDTDFFTSDSTHIPSPAHGKGITELFTKNRNT